MSKLTFDQLLSLKLLLSVEGIGPGKIRNLLAKFRTSEKVLSADFKTLTEADGIGNDLARRIQRINAQRKNVESALKKDLDILNKINGKIITVYDESFPSLLKKIYDPPLLLYIKGSF